MNVAVDFIVTLCIRKNIIKEENIAWFRYGLEKRIVTLVVGIPFVLMGIAISNIWTALSFFLSFFFLRTRMNGYHAKSILGCLICSLALELLFLGGIAHWINTYFKLPEEMHVDKASELVHRVKEWVDEEYQGGRVTVLTDEELLVVIEKNCKKLGLTLERGIFKKND